MKSRTIGSFCRELPHPLLLRLLQYLDWLVSFPRKGVNDSDLLTHGGFNCCRPWPVRRHKRSIMSRTEQTSNTDLKLVSSSTSSTRGVTFNNLSSVPVAWAHVRRETSIPKPAASTALISAKSRTTVRLGSGVRIALRKTSASPAMIRPAHLSRVTLPKLWIVRLSMVAPFDDRRPAHQLRA